MSYITNPFSHPSPKRREEIDTNTPYEKLKGILEKYDSHSPKTTGVVHWFRNKDLRVEDNKALYHASQKAYEAKKPFISLYLYCPTSLIWHGISSAKMDFMFETLKDLQKRLNSLNIPLVVLPIQQLSDSCETLLSFCKKHIISEIYANHEYEIDELQRDHRLVESLQSKVKFFYYHDQCVIEPGILTNKQNKPLQVFTRYHKNWTGHIKQFPNLIKTLPAPKKQSSQFRKQLASLFTSVTFKLPKEKQFKDKHVQKALRKLWPAGHKKALEKLDSFIKHHMADYAVTRHQPAWDSSSKMSPYLSIGSISPRTILEKMIKPNKGSHYFSLTHTPAGIFSWVREIVFREFYRHQLVVTPHLSMNMPQNYKFSFVHWEEDKLGWEKWRTGQTGVPWIDAGMRQLRQEAYMHNRLRMSVACYLYSVLLIDYRDGERYFAETLIDYDLANNVQGWSPNYTLFNPILQAEKNDPEGAYIRKWVPELKSVAGKAVFDPYHRLTPAEFDRLGYPKPYMNWKASKQRSRARFKAALDRSK